jgi:hypothetical protein
MNRRASQFSLTFLMILIACIALNLWLFKQGILWGIIGLNISKHVVIAYLCRNLGVNRSTDPVLGDPFADPE